MAHPMAIDLRKLRHVVETARFESVTRAAASLYITQSALTRSIAEVEAELGLKLFIRLPRGVRATEAGGIFVKRARQILGDVDDLIATAEDYRDLKTGRVRIGVAPPAFQRFMARPLAAVAGEHQGLSIDVVSGSADELAPRLTAGDFDLVIGHCSWLSRWPDLAITRVADFHCAMMLRRNHPLAGRTDVEEIDVLRYPAILPSIIEPLETDIASRYAANDLPPLNPRYTGDDFDLLCALTAATDAYTPIISLNPTFGRLHDDFLLLEDVVKMPTQAIGYAVSRMRALSPAATAVVAEIRRLIAPGG